MDINGKRCLTANENGDDSWVVTTEGPRGPKCTKSAGALIGLSARNGRVSTGALENTSAGALRKSTGTLDTSTGALQGEWGALEERTVLILSSMKSTPTGRGQLTVSVGYGR